MKILYVKNNSERAKAFQLKTVIYEEDGQKYVKKQALNTEAIPHLKKMKESYEKLTASILNPKIKLAKIIDETENSLTFEFIDGESLEKRFNDASGLGESAQAQILKEYISLLKNDFKTVKFDSSTMLTDTNKVLFGKLDFNDLQGEVCFDDISNMDLIFSNIIYKEDTIYLIDYEWAYMINIPIDYIVYRTISMLPPSDKFSKYISSHALMYHKMERHFVDKYVMKDGFYFQKNKYIKTNAQIAQHIEAKEAHIQELKQNLQGKEDHINELASRINILTSQVNTLGYDLSYARAIVELRDRQLDFRNNQITFLNQLTIKRRLKQQIKKNVPDKILTMLGFDKYSPLVFAMEDFPTEDTLNIVTIKDNTLYQYKKPEFTSILQEEIKNLEKRPLISIIMPVYNVAPKWLDLAIKSIEDQWYDNWELCLADDKSTNKDIIGYLNNLNSPKIKVKFLEKNLNISGASNAALEIATGDYIALMDNDDEITPDALYEMVKAINEKGAEFIYSDEDFISTEGECSNPHFKPDFSPDLLLSHNYITHLTCFKKELLDKVGHFNSKFDGSQDFDLFLRLTEKTSKIQHIPKVLYHWRMLETSTSVNSEAKPEAIERGKLVLEEALKRRNEDVTIEHANLHHYFRVKYDIKDNPLVSIIIPFKDKPELLDMSINSILEKSTYQNYEIIGISNNSEQRETFDMMMALEKKDPRVSFYEYNTEFNYADINNYGVNTYAKGEHILLLNNDIEVISPDWIEAMLEHSQREKVGCVGAKLYFPNDTVQHAGVIIGLGGYAGHSHKMYPRDNPGYFNRLSVVQNLSAVTAACLMIKKSIYNEINGMDEVKFKVAYNDVDFCLRVLEKGYLNIFTPYAEMYHHESISRGYETTPEKMARFQTEKDALFERHKEILTKGDPYYNPNLTHDREDFSLCTRV